DEANKPDSVIRLQQVVLDPSKDLQKTETLVVQPKVAQEIGKIADPVERRVAEVTQKVIASYEFLPGSASLLDKEVQNEIAKKVAEQLTPSQLELEGVVQKPDISAIVRQTSGLIVQYGIDIPQVSIFPKGEVTSGYHSFKLDTAAINYQPVEHDLL